MPSRLRRLTKATVYAVVTGLVLVTFALLIRERFDPLVRADEGAIRQATDFTRGHPAFRSALVAWQEATQPKWIYPAASLLCLVLWRAKRVKGRALWAFVTMMVAWGLANLAKPVVHRERPLVADPVSHSPGFSFPSGHAAGSAAVAATVVVLLWPLMKPGLQRSGAVVAAAAAMVATDLDRVFLGVHYPSDVVAGTILGVGLVLASYAGYTDWAPTHPTTAHPESLPGTPGDVPDRPPRDDVEPAGMSRRPSQKESAE